MQMSMSGRRCISWNTRGENVGLRRGEGEGMARKREKTSTTSKTIPSYE